MVVVAFYVIAATIKRAFEAWSNQNATITLAAIGLTLALGDM